MTAANSAQVARTLALLAFGHPLFVEVAPHRPRRSSLYSLPRIRCEIMGQEITPLSFSLLQGRGLVCLTHVIGRTQIYRITRDGLHFIGESTGGAS